MSAQVGWLDLDLDTWLKLLSLVGTFIAWIIANRRRPRLEAFFTHGAGHQIATNPPTWLNTHSLVVRNSGAAPATNVRITHAFVPQHTDIQIYPNQPFTVAPVAPQGNELVFERLRPQEQLTVSYLYPAGTLLDQFHTFVRFDEGFALFFPIQHVRIIPRWLRIVLYYFLSVGFCLTLYLLLKAFLFLFVLA
jgi:hypothetical protein